MEKSEKIEKSEKWNKSEKLFEVAKKAVSYKNLGQIEAIVDFEREIHSLDLEKLCKKAESLGIREQLPACNVKLTSCSQPWGSWSECHCSSDRPFRMRFRLLSTDQCHQSAFQLDESELCMQDCQDTFGNKERFLSYSSSGTLQSHFKLSGPPFFR